MEPRQPSTTATPDDTALLHPEEFKSLAARMQRNARRYAVLNFTIYSVWFVIIFSSFWSMWVSPAIPIWFTALFVLILTITTRWLLKRWFMAHVRKEGRKIERLIQLAASTQDANMLGPILDLQDISILPETRKSIDSAVLRLLPFVQTSHADALSAKQRERIGDYFFSDQSRWGARRSDNLPYAQGVLHALEQIGDKRDLLYIEGMLEAGGISEELCASIQRCADIVRERVAHEEGKDFLLRPDSKPKTAETLLRPAAERADASPHQLLRAANFDNADGEIRPGT